MIYRLSDTSEIDEKIVEMLKTYFFDDIDFKSKYKRFGNLNITKIHPFARLLSDMTKNKLRDVFPAISVALIDDTSNDIVLNRGIDKIEFTSSLLRELDDQKYSLNRDQVFRALRKILSTGKKLYATQINRRYVQKIVIEIWSENDIIKDMLYEGVKDFIDFYSKTLYDLGVENITVSGKKDGDYNFDFGTVLFGSMVTITAVIPNMIFEIDTGVEAIGQIDHVVSDINATNP